MFCTTLARLWLTAMRWQLLLNSMKRVSVHRLFGFTMIGFMANQVLPARLGEFVRAYALGRSEALSVPQVFATIVVERVFDGFTLLLFLVTGVLFFRSEPWLVWAAIVSRGLYAGVLISLVSLRGHRIRLVLEAPLGWLPDGVRARVGHVLDSFTLGLAVLEDPRAILGVGALSLAVCLVGVAGLHAAFAAFALDLPFHAGLLVTGIVAVMLVLPAGLGFIGTSQFGAVVAVGLYGVPEATALSLSVVYHVTNAVPIIAIGLFYLGMFGMTLGELRTAGRRGHWDAV
jgi:uncharacterized protein (TIRG00374 family)